MISILRRKPPIPSRIILRRTQSTSHPYAPPNTNDLEKPFTLRSRPFLFAGTFVGLYQVIKVGTGLFVFLYFRYTNSSTYLLGGPIATFVFSLPVPLTNGERNIGDVVDTALRRAMALNWSSAFWLPQWKTSVVKATTTQDPGVIEDVLDRLEGPNNPQGRRRRELGERSTETGFVAISGEQIGRFVAVSGEQISRFGGWGGKQIENLKGSINRMPSQDELRRTAGEWKDSITSISVTRFIEPQQGTLKKLTDAAAVYVILKALLPVRLGAALIFTPNVAKWVVAAWRRF